MDLCQIWSSFKDSGKGSMQHKCNIHNYIYVGQIHYQKIYCKFYNSCILIDKFVLGIEFHWSSLIFSGSAYVYLFYLNQLGIQHIFYKNLKIKFRLFIHFPSKNKFSKTFVYRIYCREDTLLRPSIHFSYKRSLSGLLFIKIIKLVL